MMRPDVRCNADVVSMLAVAAATLLFFAAAPAQAQTWTVLHDFSRQDSGSYAGVTFDQQGRIYGTTPYGGSHGNGVVFRMVHEGEGWIYTPIYSFSAAGLDGSMPLGGVVFGTNGLLYGITSQGGAYGYGAVFSLQPPPNACKTSLCPWIETVLYSFNFDAGGVYPGYENLVFDPAGNIYGTTFNSEGGNGVVFKLSRSGSGWTETVLWHFTGGDDGSYPASGVILDGAGNVYGTTSLDGAHGGGTVYELSPTQSGWNETTLYSFSGFENGVGDGGLTWDVRGDLFGISGAPLQSYYSTAYELTPGNGDWSYAELQYFGYQSDGPVAAPTFDSQGNLYGPLPSGGSNGYGEIFKLTPSDNQWIYSPYYQFPSCYDGNGCYPIGAVTFDANGNMYGTTGGGGLGFGTVWEITP